MREPGLVRAAALAEGEQESPARETGAAEAAVRAVTDLASAQDQWKARYSLAWHRAETERLRVLVDFLGRPVHAHGGPEPDPDIVTAYNLAVEAALRAIRRSALAGD